MTKDNEIIEYKAELFDELLECKSEDLLVYGAVAKVLVDRFKLNEEAYKEEAKK